MTIIPCFWFISCSFFTVQEGAFGMYRSSIAHGVLGMSKNPLDGSHLAFVLEFWFWEG